MVERDENQPIESEKPAPEPESAPASETSGVEESQSASAEMTEEMARQPDPIPTPEVGHRLRAKVITIGEETGALDAMLGKIADFYEAEVDAALESLTAALEPVMIVLVGGIVLVVLLALYMPIFSVSGQVSGQE